MERAAHHDVVEEVLALHLAHADLEKTCTAAEAQCEVLRVEVQQLQKEAEAHAADMTAMQDELVTALAEQAAVQQETSDPAFRLAGTGDQQRGTQLALAPTMQKGQYCIPLRVQLQRIMSKYKVSSGDIRPLTISLLAALAGVPEDRINIRLPCKSTANNDTHAVAALMEVDDSKLLDECITFSISIDGGEVQRANRVATIAHARRCSSGLGLVDALHDEVEHRTLSYMDVPDRSAEGQGSSVVLRTSEVHERGAICLLLFITIFHIAVFNFLTEHLLASMHM